MSISSRMKMKDFREMCRQIGVMQRLSSVKITVICLFWLFVLTFWGTIAQVQQGLYLAQERFFYSFYFLVLGFLPFPGARMVLWILFVNLVCVSITRFVYNRSHLGIVIIHIGLLTYFFSAFVTFHVTKESNVTLREGQATNVSTAYRKWELSVWPDHHSDEKEVYAYDSDALESGEILPFEQFGFNLVVKKYFLNVNAFKATVPKRSKFINKSGISEIASIRLEREPEKNLPGGIFELHIPQEEPVYLLLFGGEVNATSWTVKGKTYHFQLRRKRYPLPFIIQLDDFKKELYPGTQTAKSYESFLTVAHSGIERDVRIYMNHPLRYKNFTLYQASYAIDAMGRELSTLAVVKNSGRLLPYIASLITVVGLLIHFLMMAFMPKRKKV